MAGKLILDEVRKSYGDFAAVRGVSFAVAGGECVVLLGPSGCGKTTTLRMVAGFLRPDGGRILIDGKPVASTVSSLPPHQRGVALVFQSYAVWPHRTVFENVAYGLTLRRVPKREIETRVNEMLAVVQLSGLGSRYPGELSGGQQQRVSLARSLVISPSILLLDEPLSNLDATLREEMRFELKAIQRRLGITMLYVTHDQSEAMVIADRIVVMNHGLIEQIGPPEDIYIRSATPFVAGFVGLTNFLRGRLAGPCTGVGAAVEVEGMGRVEVAPAGGASGRPAAGAEVTLNIRPEDIQLLHGREGEAPNTLPGVVRDRSFLGSFLDYRIQVGGAMLRAQAPKDAPYEIGAAVFVRLDPDKIRYFAAGNGQGGEAAPLNPHRA